MQLVLRPGGWVLAWVVALEIVAAANLSSARRELSEQELTARIQEESSLTRKAKLEIQLADLKLEQAIAAYDRDQFDAGHKLLETYWSWMQQAWDLLQKSGRDAGRKPQGFKDLDIALRETSRRLNDLKQRTPYLDRHSIENVAAQIDSLHTEVLAALFPGGQLKEEAPPAPSKPAPAANKALRPGDPPR